MDRVSRPLRTPQVAIGDCGRSYDTPCIHEHSCLRCPLLRPDPDERGRLTQIHDNLQARIAEAETHRWFGEAEGLKLAWPAPATSSTRWTRYRPAATRP